MNKKGFTLVELLGAIVLLGVIALIVTPIVSNLIKQSQSSADLRSAEGYIKAAENYYADALGDKDLKETLGTNIIDKVNMNNKNATGAIIAYKDGTIGMALIINNKCYMKSTDQDIKDISVSNDLQSCVLATPKECFRTELTANYILKKDDENAVNACANLFVEDGLTADDAKSFCQGNDITRSGHVYNIDDMVDQFMSSEEIANYLTSADAYNYVTVGDNATLNISGYYKVNPKTKAACPKNVVIPSTIDGYSVTSIRAVSHSDSIPHYSSSTLDKYNADFLNKQNQYKIEETLSDGGTYSDDYYGTFVDAELTGIVIPSSITSIMNGSFNGNYLPDNQAFIYARNSDGTENKTKLISYGGEKLDDVIIPDGVTTIDESAFRYDYLNSVTIPDSVTSIGDYAFDENQLTSVTIPNGVTSMGNYVFSDNQLTSVIIPSGVTSIGESAFDGNELTSITIPDSVKAIGEFAFTRNLLTSISIPDSVISIEAFAFSFNRLTSVTIPDSVTSIGMDAFVNNTTLTSFVVDNFKGTIAGSPWGTLDEIITYNKNLTFDSSITDLIVDSVSKSGTTYTAILSSTDVTKGITSVTANGKTFTGNSITFTGDTVNVTAYTYEKVEAASIASTHDYAVNLNGDVEGTSLWTTTFIGASSVSITFNSSSATENNYDYIYIYDGSGNEIQKLCGKTMAGQIYTVTGDTIVVKLTSDGSETDYGFEALIKKVS